MTSREVYERETTRIFACEWLCVAHVDQLQRHNDILALEVENHKLILVRDDAGEIRALRNICRHRGSLLVTAANCDQLGQRIQCPYHAWTYDRCGQLLSAPNMDGVDKFAKEEHGLIEVPSATYGGFVWINFRPQQPLEEYLAPLAAQFTNWSTAELQLAATRNYEVRANWKLIFQNYSECYHCPSVHPALNRLTPYQGADNHLDHGPILGGPMRLADDCYTMSETGEWVGRRLPQLSDAEARCVHYFTIFPSMFLSTHPDYVLVHLVRRLDVDRSAVVCLFLFHPQAIQDSGFEPDSAVSFWDLTNRQDWEVCELAQAGMQSAGYVPGPYSPLESVVAAFDRYYHHQLGNGWCLARQD